MKNKIFTFVTFVVIAVVMPLICAKAKYDAEKATAFPDTATMRVMIGDSSPKRAEKSAPAPEYTIEEQIAAINAGYAEINEWKTPKAAALVRYQISGDERREIERIVASEGGYCGYEFQALVAECILNGCEAENMRPLELFERGDFWITHDVAPDETTKRAVSDVFDRGIFPTIEKVRYYYNPNYCKSAVHEQMCYVLTCCNCRFFKDWE